MAGNLDLSHSKLKAFDVKVFASDGIFKRDINLEGNELNELRNLHKISSVALDFKLAKIQFTCQRLKQISNTKNVILRDDSWQQKDGTNWHDNV